MHFLKVRSVSDVSVRLFFLCRLKFFFYIVNWKYSGNLCRSNCMCKFSPKVTFRTILITKYKCSLIWPIGQISLLAAISMWGGGLSGCQWIGGHSHSYSHSPLLQTYSCGFRKPKNIFCVHSKLHIAHPFTVIWPCRSHLSPHIC